MELHGGHDVLVLRTKPEKSVSSAGFGSLPRHVRKAILVVVARIEDRRAVPQLCTVGREWQEVLEHYTFSELHLTPPRLEPFAQIVDGPRRRSCVQSIVLHVELDPYERHKRDERETEEERQRSAEVFTATIEAFLGALALWGKEERSLNGLELNLMVFSPSDVPRKMSRSGKPSALTRRAQASALKLAPTAAPLPCVDVITGLRCTGRHILPTSVMDIVSRLRNLSFLDVRLNHDSSDGRDVHQRRKFASGLQHRAQSVTNVNLHRTIGSSGSARAPTVEQGASFYRSLRRFTQRLETFVFDDCLDACEFFAPFMDGPEIPRHLPYWDKLEMLSVRNSYLVKRPYLRASNRVEALTAVFKLLSAVGQAARHMPKLRKARVCQYVLTEDQLEWFIVTYRYQNGKASLDFKGLMPSRVMVETWQSSISVTRDVVLKISVSPSEQNVL